MSPASPALSEQPKQGRTLVGSCSATNHVISIASQRDAIIVVGELKNGFVGRIFRQYFPQEHNFMRKFFE